MDRLNIVFENFEPDHDSIQEFKASLGYALGKGPSDASATATVTYEDDEYRCDVIVHSSQGHFQVECRDDDLEELFNEVCESLVEDFEEWHEDPTNEKFSHK